MINHDKPYLDLCQHILDHGVKKEDRTGTGTLSVFGYQMRFDLSKGFPLLTSKQMPPRIIFEELDWFLEGCTDAAVLARRNVHIWTPDAYRWHIEQGGTMSLDEFKIHLKNPDTVFDLGPIYGKQWRSWLSPNLSAIGELKENEFIDEFPVEVIDQISGVIHQIKENPDSRRLIVSAWNPGELKDMALPPCHILFQFYVANGKLSCQLYQRSGDVFLGVPFNIASYAFLVHMVAQQCDLEVGEFVHTLGDAHIYLNHLDQVREQLSRTPRPTPTLTLDKAASIFDYKWEDVHIDGYDPHPLIKGKVSVG